RTRRPNSRRWCVRRSPSMAPATSSSIGCLLISCASRSSMVHRRELRLTVVGSGVDEGLAVQPLAMVRLGALDQSRISDEIDGGAGHHLGDMLEPLMGRRRLALR